MSGACLPPHTPLRAACAAVFVALKNKMDLAIGVALGSSIQIAVFVLPLVVRGAKRSARCAAAPPTRPDPPLSRVSPGTQVLAGWVMGRPFTLVFDMFGVIMLTRAPPRPAALAASRIRSRPAARQRSVLPRPGLAQRRAIPPCSHAPPPLHNRAQCLSS